MNQISLIQINKLLLELVQEHECVVINGFGGLLSHYEPARIDDTKNQIYPPSNSLSFNTLLTKNDGVFAQAFSLKFGITYSQAVQEINRFVFEMSSVTSKNEEFVISGIGIFFKGKEGKIQFKQDVKDNLLLQSYGLSSVKAQVVQHDGISGRIKDEYVSRHASPVINHKIRRYSAAVASSVLILFVFMWSAFNLDKIESHSEALSISFHSLWATEESSDDVSDSSITSGDQLETGTVGSEIKEIIPVELESAIPEYSTFDLDSEITYVEEVSAILNSEASELNIPDVAAISTEAEHADKTDVDVSREVLNKVPAKKEFVVVAGCFKSTLNANRFVKKLQSEGYEAHLCGHSSSGLNRVAYSSFENRSEALNLLTTIRMDHNAQAWITSW